MVAITWLYCFCQDLGFYHHLFWGASLVISFSSDISILMQSYVSHCFLFNFKIIDFAFWISRIFLSILLYINDKSMLNTDILLYFSLCTLSDFIYWHSSFLSPAKQCPLSQNMEIVWTKIIDFSTYVQMFECEM